jgi:hypothetical protein
MQSQTLHRRRRRSQATRPRLTNSAKVDRHDLDRDSRNSRPLSRGMKTVEIQIQFQNVHARFAKESQVAALRMFLYKRAQVVFFHAARTGHTRNLEFCSRRRNIRV